MSRNQWTEEEVKCLQDNMDKSLDELMELISRSRNAIRIKRETLRFEPKKSICTRCKKQYTRVKRQQVCCERCEQIIAQERRIKKQVAKIEAAYEEEKKIIAKLSAEDHVCTECGATKKGSEFHYMRATQTLRRKCKACMSIKSKEARKKRISEGREW